MAIRRFDSSNTTSLFPTGTSQELRSSTGNTSTANSRPQGTSTGHSDQNLFTRLVRSFIPQEPPATAAPQVEGSQSGALQAPPSLDDSLLSNAVPTFASVSSQGLDVVPSSSLGVRPGDLVASAVPASGVRAQAVQVSGPNASLEEVYKNAMSQFGLQPTRPGETGDVVLRARLKADGKPLVENVNGRYVVQVVQVPLVSPAAPDITIKTPRPELKPWADSLRDATQKMTAIVERGGYVEESVVRKGLAPYVQAGVISQSDVNKLVAFNNEARQMQVNVQDQSDLRNLGYYTGKLDGVVGQGTKQAITTFQLNNGLSPDGVIGPETRSMLANPNAVTLQQARGYQQSLQQLGFYSGQPDGVMGTGTRAAITNFQAANGLKVDGRIGPETQAALQNPNAVTAPQVKGAQQRLQELGYYTGQVDGVWNASSQQAYREFQQASGQQASGRLSGTGLTALQNSEAPLSPKHPALQSIPERVFGMFKGIGLEALDVVKGLGDTAKLLNDANPLLMPTGILADLIVSPITGKSPGEIVNGRVENFKQAGNVLLQQGAAVLKLASDLSTPAQVTNYVKMTDAVVRDLLALNDQGKLTPGAVAQVIAERTGQNPSIQAASTVLDSVTNYKKIIESGGDPVEIGRGTFRIFETLAGFAKPAARGLKVDIPNQPLGRATLSQVERSLLDSLGTPGSQAVVPRGDINLDGLARLTKESGREFALLTRGNERMLIAGDATSVPLTPDRMRQLSSEGWKLTAHSHTDGLTPSVGDANVVAAGGQRRSIIVDSENGRVSFTPDDGVGGATDNLSAGSNQGTQRNNNRLPASADTTFARGPIFRDGPPNYTPDFNRWLSEADGRNILDTIFKSKPMKDERFRSRETLSLTQDIDGRLFVTTSGNGLHRKQLEAIKQLEQQYGIKIEVFQTKPSADFPDGIASVQGRRDRLSTIGTEELERLREQARRNGVDPDSVAGLANDHHAERRGFKAAGGPLPVVSNWTTQGACKNCGFLMQGEGGTIPSGYQPSIRLPQNPTQGR